MSVLDLKISHCHRRADRSFFWKGKQFPVCARCTGIHLGYLSLPFFVFRFLSIDILWTLFLIAPTYFDAMTQIWLKRESNNVIRVTTGLMAGIGAMSLMAIIGNFIGKQILILIK